MSTPAPVIVSACLAGIPCRYDGAAAVARRAVELEARRAVLKDLSPSCGAGRVYDGTFSGTVREGDGVVAAALSEAGLDVGAR